MALMTIHMIGKNPKAAPSSPLFTASPTDMEYAATATIRATASPMTDASAGGRVRGPPSRRNIDAFAHVYGRKLIAAVRQVQPVQVPADATVGRVFATPNEVDDRSEERR